MKSGLFSKLIRDYRKQNKVTQQDLVQLIVSAEDGFNGLDAVTISRWENDVTKPVLYKKIKIAKLIGIDWYKYTIENLSAISPKTGSLINRKLSFSQSLMLEILNIKCIKIDQLTNLNSKDVWHGINQYLFKSKQDYEINLFRNINTYIYLSLTGVVGYYSTYTLSDESFWLYMSGDKEICQLEKNNNHPTYDSIIIGGYYGITEEITRKCLSSIINNIVNNKITRVGIICHNAQQRIVAEKLGFKEHQSVDISNNGTSVMYAETETLKYSTLFYNLYIYKYKKKQSKEKYD